MSLLIERGVIRRKKLYPPSRRKGGVSFPFLNRLSELKESAKYPFAFSFLQRMPLLFLRIENKSPRAAL